MTKSLTIGFYAISFINHGYVWLDGGSMFGSVPKPLWSKSIEPDEKNRIKLATRSLLIEDSKNNLKILVDVGCGDKWSDKEKAIYNFTQEENNLVKDSVTDIILTHLHFDHAGGITYFDSNKNLKLSYPNAKIHLQESNYLLAKEPNLRERASYLSSHVEPLKDANLCLINGTKEIYSGIFVHQIDGHTVGQQYIEIRSDDKVLLYPTDLIPTSHHLPLPYHMGYDMCAATVLKEKQAFLEYAVKTEAIVVFEHDAEVAAATIGISERGHYGVKDRLELKT